jgi:hypothetical protein
LDRSLIFGVRRDHLIGKLGGNAKSFCIASRLAHLIHATLEAVKAGETEATASLVTGIF